MPVSTGLQKYFDSRKGKRDDTQARFASLASQIDPAFMQSFCEFREKILNIIEENPEEESIVEEELLELESQLQYRQRVHSLQKANSIIQASEKK